MSPSPASGTPLMYTSQILRAAASLCAGAFFVGRLVSRVWVIFFDEVRGAVVFTALCCCEVDADDADDTGAASTPSLLSEAPTSCLLEAG